MVANNAFRDDLYHRIRGWRIELPPLRARRSDIARHAAAQARSPAHAEARAAELRAVEAAGKLETASAALESAERELRDDAARREQVSTLEVDLRHHNELDSALTRLRGELNSTRASAPSSATSPADSSPRSPTAAIPPSRSTTRTTSSCSMKASPSP
jgi:transcriptional regulator with GAF, ATPase, and Fis domain